MDKSLTGHAGRRKDSGVLIAGVVSDKFASIVGACLPVDRLWALSWSNGQAMFGVMRREGLGSPVKKLLQTEHGLPHTRSCRNGFFASLRMTGVSVLFFLGFLIVANAAEPEMRLSPKKIRDEVHTTVETQLNALREGNFEAAYEMASSGIKAQFDVRLFAALIRHGYPVLLQANEADLGIVRDRNGEVAQVTVSVLDRQKRSIVYSYWLVKEEAGWRINGVVLQQKPARGDT